MDTLFGIVLLIILGYACWNVFEWVCRTTLRGLKRHENFCSICSVIVGFLYGLMTFDKSDSILLGVIAGLFTAWIVAAILGFIIWIFSSSSRNQNVDPPFDNTHYEQKQLYTHHDIEQERQRLVPDPKARELMDRMGLWKDGM